MIKNGFTLIELLAVIVILGVISVISFTSVIKIEQKSKEKLYSEQVAKIESSAKLWAINNSFNIQDGGVYELNLSELIESNFLENDDIINPIDKSIMNGCVNITYDLNQYSYVYDSSCGLLSFKLSYNLNGGKLEQENRSFYTFETDSFQLNNPTKVGYTFLGWDETKLTPNILDNIVDVVIPKGSTGDRHYEAIWTPIQYTITYNANGGSIVGGVNPITYNVETPNIYIIPPQKEGKAFLGWSGTDVSIRNKAIIIPKGSIGNRHYEAIWQDTVYNLTINPNGGFWNNTQDISYMSLSVDSMTSIDFPTMVGYNFKNWTLVGEGSSISGRTFVMGNTHAILVANYIDDIPPICNPVKTNLGTTSGVTITANCTDEGSGLAVPSPILYNQTASLNMPIADNSGNTYTLNVPVTTIVTDYRYRNCQVCVAKSFGSWSEGTRGCTSGWNWSKAGNDPYNVNDVTSTRAHSDCHTGSSYPCSNSAAYPNYCIIYTRTITKDCTLGCLRWPAWSEWGKTIYTPIQDSGTYREVETIGIYN